MINTYFLVYFLNEEHVNLCVKKKEKKKQSTNKQKQIKKTPNKQTEKHILNTCTII